MVDTQIADAIKNVVMNFDSVQRNILEMHYYDDLTIDDISVVTKLPVDQVKSLLFSASNQIRSIIKNDGMTVLSIMQ